MSEVRQQAGTTTRATGAAQQRGQEPSPDPTLGRELVDRTRPALPGTVSGAGRRRQVLIPLPIDVS